MGAGPAVQGYGAGPVHHGGHGAGRGARPGSATGPAGPAVPSLATRACPWACSRPSLVSFAPAAALVVLGVAVALLVSGAILGAWQASIRALVTAVGATVVAAILCLPWLIGTMNAGRAAINVFGVASAPSTAPSWGALLRFAVGPIGVSPLAWGFIVAALLPLLVGRGARFRWAARCWSVAIVFWLLAWVIGRGWAGNLAVDPMILLGPAAAAITMAIGLGIAAFEEDLRSATFGWKQAATGLAAIAVVLGALPTVISALPGRWDLPTTDTAQTVAWMHAKVAAGAFRVLWLGDARALNLGSWSAGSGLAYATSENGAPDATWLWNAADQGPARSLADAVDLARSGRTNRLGQLLAPSGVRYVAVVTALAPVIPGLQQTQRYPLPADLEPGLAQQLDLHPVVSQSGITVYENADWIPMRAEVPAKGAARPDTSIPSPLNNPPGTPIVSGLRPVLPGPTAATSYQGPLVPGTVLASLAPADRWALTDPAGQVLSSSPSFGWAARYAVTGSGTGTLRFTTDLWTPLGVTFQVVVWLAALTVLARRRHAPRGGAAAQAGAAPLDRGRPASRSSRPPARPDRDGTRARRPVRPPGERAGGRAAAGRRGARGGSGGRRRPDRPHGAAPRSCRAPGPERRGHPERQRTHVVVVLRRRYHGHGIPGQHHHLRDQYRDARGRRDRDDDRVHGQGPVIVPPDDLGPARRGRRPQSGHQRTGRLRRQHGDAGRGRGGGLADRRRPRWVVHRSVCLGHVGPLVLRRRGDDSREPARLGPLQSDVHRSGGQRLVRHRCRGDHTPALPGSRGAGRPGGGRERRRLRAEPVGHRHRGGGAVRPDRGRPAAA